MDKVKDLAPGESLSEEQKAAIISEVGEHKKAEKEKADKIKSAKVSADLGIAKVGTSNLSADADTPITKGVAKAAVAGSPKGKSLAGGGVKAAMALSPEREGKTAAPPAAGGGAKAVQALKTGAAGPSVTKGKAAAGGGSSTPKASAPKAATGAKKGKVKKGDAKAAAAPPPAAAPAPEIETPEVMRARQLAEEVAREVERERLFKEREELRREVEQEIIAEERRVREKVRETAEAGLGGERGRERPKVRECSECECSSSVRTAHTCSGLCVDQERKKREKEVAERKKQLKLIEDAFDGEVTCQPYYATEPQAISSLRSRAIPPRHFPFQSQSLPTQPCATPPHPTPAPPSLIPPRSFSCSLTR